MHLTFIGAIQAMVAVALLLFGTVPAMFAFLLVSGMFGGSAAIALPALGGSTIPPVQFALVFMVLRLMLPGAGQMPRLQQATRANLLLLAFVAYGVLMAYLGPRLFARQIEVTPLRGRVEARYVSAYAYLYATRALVPTTQNITTSIYLIGTMLVAMSSYIACSYQRGRDLLVKTGVCIALAHVALGLIGIAVRGTPVDIVFDLFRNGNYAQINTSFRGFVRINGVWPEASSYAIYGYVWFVFLTECWLRGVQTRWTGFAALALALTLVFSTATTAYAGLALYGVCFALRALIFPHSLRFARAVSMAAAGLAVLVAASAMLLLVPAFAQNFTELLAHMTVDKVGSNSGTQRAFWAQQGIDAFLFTNGIGIGPGSFRSSSLFTAIMGCMGLVGVTTFVAYVFQVFKPLRASTFMPQEDAGMSIGAAASWAVLMLTITVSFSSPTCDPGPEFAVFAGAALALRSSAALKALRKPRRLRTAEGYVLVGG